MQIRTMLAVTGALFLIYSLAVAQDQRINLGPEINSQYSELNPVITSDNQILFFTLKGDPRNVGASVRPDDEDIWFTRRRSDGTWGPAEHLEGPLNTTGYDGVRAVNKSVTRLYLQNQYLADGKRAKGYSVSEIGPDGIWAYPVPLVIDNYYNDTTVATMTVSNDENVILFSLKRKDTKGGHDIYVSFRRGKYEFTEPQLVDALSTEGDEVAPFIGFDDHTIYVPSTGWGSMNGLHDIYVTRRLDNTWLHWSPPERLPMPINSPSSDFYFTLSAQGDTAYVASWDETSTRGYGRSDLWKCGMPEYCRPGTFIPGSELAHNGVKRTTPDTGPIVGSLIRLDNVFFDVNKNTLRPESKEPMEKLLKLLKEYPKLRLEVQGHTDSDGADEVNMALSQGRAETVVRYLVEHGISASRLKAKGYGKDVPIASNATPFGKQLNRRVMLLVTGYEEGAK